MIRVRLIIICLIILAFTSTYKCFGNEKGVPIRVLCASSLQESFKELAKEFEKENKNVDLELNFAGTQQIYNQAIMGIQADIFASADEYYSKQLTKQGIQLQNYLFAHNSIIVGINKNNSSIKSLEDLAKKNIRLATAHKSVPIGEYSNIILDRMNKSGKYDIDFKAKILKNIVTQDLDVQSLVSKVILGEADAGFMYATNITKENQKYLKKLSIPENFNVKANYYIGILKVSPQKPIAKKFIDFVLSDKGQRILQKYHFIPIGKRNGK